MRIFRLFLLSIFVLGLLWAGSVNLPQGAESASAQESAAGAEDATGQIIMSVSKIDMDLQLMIPWWTPDVWAFMAYTDKTPDAIMGYYLMSTITKNHHIFALMPMGEGENNKPKIEGAPVLVNDKSIKSGAVPIHASLNALMPGLVAFPKKDAKGKELVTPASKFVKMRVKFKGVANEKVYQWDLPLMYPDSVKSAVQWIQSQMDKNVSDMTEDELYMHFLAPVLRVNLPSGIIAAPMTKQLFDALFQKDPDVNKDPALREFVKAMVDTKDFFIILSLDMETNPKRLAKAVEKAVLVDAKGKKYPVDKKALDLFVSKSNMGKPDFGELMIFPNLGKGKPVKLILKDPDTGKDVVFQWTL